MAQLGAFLAVALATGLCQSFTMQKKQTTGSAVDLKKRLADTTAKAARLKAATHQMEDAVRELEDRLHEVEATAKQVHEKIRKP